MTRLPALLLIGLGALAAGACGRGGPAAEPTPLASDGPMRAAATLESKSDSTATGTAEFEEGPDGTRVTITVQGAQPGRRGLHLHENGDCSAPDASSAGEHFAPAAHGHGAPGPDSHAGDLGNIDIAADGTGTLSYTSTTLTVSPGPASVVGRAVVLHGGTDDLASQPSGNSGPRVACGVIGPR